MDIAFGAVGFLAMFVVYAFIRMLIKVIIGYVNEKIKMKGKSK